MGTKSGGILSELKLWHKALGIALALGTPATTAYTSYIQTAAELKNEQTYVKKSDLKELSDKLDKVNLGLAEIQGFIRGRERGRHDR